MKTKYGLLKGAVAAVALALTASPAMAGHHHHHYYYQNGYAPVYHNGGYYGGGCYRTTYYPGPAYYGYAQPVYYRPRVVLPVPFIQIGFGG